MKQVCLEKKKLIEKLVQNGVLRSPFVLSAFGKIDRKDFVPKELADSAYEDTALPIGWSQTISQPYVVAFMLELLEPKAGNHVIDVGHGSAWQTALLAEIVGESGKVYAIELVKELCAFGKSNLAKYPRLAKRVAFYCTNAASGLPHIAKEIGGFDAIIAAATVFEVPKAWREQLKVGGRLVYPKQGSIFKEIKKSGDSFEISEYHGFAFVPFVV